MSLSGWIAADTPPSVEGDYECRIENKGRVFVAKRRFKKGHWLGGCRPFSDTDVVLEWKSPAPEVSPIGRG
ncbi:hypothetical protein D3C87_2119480 [compost metagenome]